MKRKIVIFYFACLMLAGYLIGCTFKKTVRQSQVCFKTHCFTVEVVSTPADLQRGLQFRKTLGKDKGMLFVFSEDGIHTFWMKDTLIPLDMVWLDAGRHIVYIKHGAPPCRLTPCPTYGPKKPSRYVLEINGGAANAIGLKLGDQTDFNIR